MRDNTAIAAANAIRSYERIVRENGGELKDERVEQVFAELRELVSVGNHTGALGRIIVQGLLCPSDVRRVGDFKIQYQEKEDAPLQEMPVIRYLENYTPFKPDLI
jgi:hypothetical protein